MPVSATQYRSLVPLIALALLAGCGLADSKRSIDENLFLLRALEDTYTRWPTNSTADPSEIANWLTRTRTRIAAVRDSIRTHNLDPDVGRLYDDCLIFLDTYQSYLANRGVAGNSIEQDGVDLALPVFAGLREGNVAERSALRRRDGGIYLSWSTLGSAIVREPQGIGRGDDGQAVEGPGNSEEEALQAAWSETKTNAEKVARKLTIKYGWKPHEAGFDDSRSGLIESGEDVSPNPFRAIRLATQTDGGKPADLLRQAERCIQAADLTPRGATYDPFRADFLREAATLAVRATTMELRPFSYSTGPAPSAAEAVRLCERYLAANPHDPSRGAHMLLAHSLASAGRHADAIRAANEARERWDRDPNFCYRYAKLMSLTYQLDLAGEWLERAYRYGFHDIDLVRGDPDLVGLRVGHPDRFAELTDVHWSFSIVWDKPLDDVILVNESPFELTNVIVDLYIRQGGRTWEPVIRRDLLKPGESYRAGDLMSVPGSRHDEATGVLFCDQDP